MNTKRDIESLFQKFYSDKYKIERDKLCSIFGMDWKDGTYVHILTRTKEARQYGTLSIDDFHEIREEDDLFQELLLERVFIRIGDVLAKMLDQMVMYHGKADTMDNPYMKLQIYWMQCGIQNSLQNIVEESGYEEITGKLKNTDARRLFDFLIKIFL